MTGVILISLSVIGLPFVLGAWWVYYLATKDRK